MESLYSKCVPKWVSGTDGFIVCWLRELFGQTKCAGYNSNQVNMASDQRASRFLKLFRHLKNDLSAAPEKCNAYKTVVNKLSSLDKPCSLVGWDLLNRSLQLYYSLSYLLCGLIFPPIYRY